jgi:arylsulfatase A-like enzyme
MRSGMIVCGPGIPKGKRVDAFAYLFDIYPTVCELVGSKAPASLEGKSLAPILRGESKAVRDTVFLAYKDLQRAVRRGQWKLIRYPQINKSQLFDLAADPYELKDLSVSPAHKSKVDELMAVMREQQRLFGDTAALSSENPKPAEVSVEFFRNPPVIQPAQKKVK